MIKAAVHSGLGLGGVDAVDLGVVPTPVVPFMLVRRKALGGVMITASHNPVSDNGIKFFSKDGIKLKPRHECEIEEVISADGWVRTSAGPHFGEIKPCVATEDYLCFLRTAVKSKSIKRRLNVVLDCAAGATCERAPLAFQQAGHLVTAINAQFNGARVNVKSGATDLRGLAKAVKRAGADLGLGFDGDGDRVLAVDERGVEFNGDRIIALLATRLRRYRSEHAVVMTQMSNLGVELALRGRGIAMVRTEVGDINVIAAMRKRKLHLGGEQSGHIIMSDRLAAGDGILAGLQLADIVSNSQAPLSEIAAEFPLYPQRLTNLTVSDKAALCKDKKLAARLETLAREFNDVRIYIRPSGTEDVVRVLTEAADAGRCDSGNALICDAFHAWDRQR
jgi:phosphoglucosamine mutase